jgi:hypothetical protein
LLRPITAPGAEPLVGGSDSNLIPEGGLVMVYGDGGAGKTTLTADLEMHLAAGDAWLGNAIGGSRACCSSRMKVRARCSARS